MGELCQNYENGTIKGLYISMADKCSISCNNLLSFHGTNAADPNDVPYIVWTINDICGDS